MAILSTIATMGIQTPTNFSENLTMSASPDSTSADNTKLETIATSPQQLEMDTPNSEGIKLLKPYKSLPISTSSQFTPGTMNTIVIQNLEEITVSTPSTVITSIHSKDLPFSANSAATTATSVSSPSKVDCIHFIDFNDRSLEVRESRLANSILSLDEDIPKDIDETISQLIKIHTTQTINYGDHYLEYKQQMAIKRLTERKLPISKASAARRRA